MGIISSFCFSSVIVPAHRHIASAYRPAVVEHILVFTNFNLSGDLYIVVFARCMILTKRAVDRQNIVGCFVAILGWDVILLRSRRCMQDRPQGVYICNEWVTE